MGSGTKRPFASLFTFVVTVVAALVLSGNAFASGPTITSDKADYAPGETVTLYGAFWGGGESVHINVNDDAGQTWTHDADVVAGLDGSFTHSFALPDWFVAEYTVRAVGSSGLSATTTFTDGNVKINGATNVPAAPDTWTVNYATYTNSSCTAGEVSGSKTITGSGPETIVAGSNWFKVGTVTTTSSSVTFDKWTRGTASGSEITGATCIDARTGNTELFAHFKSAKQATTVSAVSGSGTYGGTASLTATLEAGTTALSGKTISFKLNGNAAGTAITNASGVATVTGVSLSGINAGTYTNAVEASFAGDSGYSSSAAQGDLAVAARPITVKATDVTRTYGESSPAFAIELAAGSSLASGDTLASLGSPVFGTDPSPAVNVGTYRINVSGLSNGNYEISYASGTARGLLTVVARPITVKANDVTRTYGNSTPAFSLAVHAGSLASGDTLASLGSPVFGTDPSPAVNVGTYRINVSGLSNGNYEISYASGTARGLLTIVARQLTVTAHDANRQYSDPNPTFTGTLMGDLPADGITASYGTSANAASGIGTYAIVPTLNDPNGKLGNYSVTPKNGTLTVTQEDARAYYTGSSLFFASSTSASSATVTLTATIKDITTVDPTLSQPNPDNAAGDIRTAKVAFVNRTGTASPALANCSNLTPSLVSDGDQTVGTVTCVTTLPVGSTSGGTAYQIGIRVGSDGAGAKLGNYIRDAGEDDTTVNVALPLTTSFITGGGYLKNPTNSAGSYAGDQERKTNFGFNVKYNKSGTNLQGNVNIIVRKGAKVYQFKSNSLTSLGVQYCRADASGNLANCAAAPTAPCTTNGTATCPITASFHGKANLNDVTQPMAVSLGGNLTLQMVMTDRGEPGSTDTLAISVYQGSTLLFSSEWNGTKTIERVLAGGNLVAH